MIQEELNWALLIALIWICFAALITLIFVIRIFVMHNVKNADGSYAWMIPSKWFDVQDKISNTQEKIAESFAQLSVQNAKVADIMQHLADATLLMHQELVRNRDKANGR